MPSWGDFLGREIHTMELAADGADPQQLYRQMDGENLPMALEYNLVSTREGQRLRLIAPERGLLYLGAETAERYLPDAGEETGGGAQSAAPARSGPGGQPRAGGIRGIGLGEKRAAAGGSSAGQRRQWYSLRLPPGSSSLWGVRRPNRSPAPRAVRFLRRRAPRSQRTARTRNFPAMKTACPGIICPVRGAVQPESRCGGVSGNRGHRLCLSGGTVHRQ